jgi:hypothetical protein
MHEGLLGEFRSEEDLERAIRELRAHGYRRLDAFTPYPARAIEKALDLPRSRLPWAAFLAAISAGASAYLLQWYLNAVDYPLEAGARPAHAAPAFVPITFEMTVLGAAFAVVLGLLWLIRLPALWHPVFEGSGFESASLDGFWVGIDARDPIFSRQQVTTDLERAGALAVTWAGRTPP